MESAVNACSGGTGFQPHVWPFSVLNDRNQPILMQLSYYQ